MLIRLQSLTLENPWILLCLTPDDSTRQSWKCLGAPGLMNYLLRMVNAGEPMGSLMDFTLSNARRFYSSTWKVLGFSGVEVNTYLQNHIVLCYKMFTKSLVGWPTITYITKCNNSYFNSHDHLFDMDVLLAHLVYFGNPTKKINISTF